MRLEVAMSYPRGLDEYTDEELHQELSRREDARARGLCDYCGRDQSTPMCRFNQRHSLVKRNP